MNIEQWPIAKIKPYANNPRKNDSAVDKVAMSLKEYGWQQPIVVDGKGVIIVGHTRWKAAKKLNMDTCPVLVAEGLSTAQVKAYRIADNKTNEFAAWDDELLKLEIDELVDLDFDIELTGFDPSDFDLGEPNGGLTDEDAVPEPPEKPVTKLGDLWVLGSHRLLCGDSTDIEQVSRLMDGQKADMVFTDPPYWVGFEYENEHDKIGILEHIDKASAIITRMCKGKIIINTGNISSIGKAELITGKKQPALLIDWWINAMNKNNFLLRHIRIWAKNGGVIPSRKNDKIDMHWEYIALFTDEAGDAGFICTFRGAGNKDGQNTGTPTWAVRGIWNDIQGKAREAGHFASFPVELVLRHIFMYTDKGDLLFEPYCGAGTVIIAAEKTNRICYGMEIDPHYCDVILKRWSEYTGKDPVREDGVKFSELKEKAVA